MQVPMASLLRRTAQLSQGVLFREKVLLTNHPLVRYLQGGNYASLVVYSSCTRGPRSAMGKKDHINLGPNPRCMQTSSEANADIDKLPDPLNPHENPLATVGDEELSEDKRYWRKRQSKSPKTVYLRKVDDEGRAFAVGKRKASVARVWLREGSGEIIVNNRHWVDYFPRMDQRDQIARPLFLLGRARMFDIDCQVTGGGSTGQAEALRHGISRAMQNWDPKWRKSLKTDGLLTRDSRVVESKKSGRKKARKSFQWVKR